MDRDAYADAVSKDWQLFAATLTNAYLTQRLGRAQTPSGVAEFRLQALGLYASFTQGVAERASAYLLGLHTPDKMDAAATHVLTLRSVAERNVSALVARLMTPGNRVANLLVRDAGALGPLIAKRAEQVDFTATDARGRTWRADKYVRLAAREFAVDAYLDAQIDKFDEAGIALLQIVYPDPAHEDHGLVLHIDEVPAIRPMIFHPNSTARLEAYVPA